MNSIVTKYVYISSFAVVLCNILASGGITVKKSLNGQMSAVMPDSVEEVNSSLARVTVKNENKDAEGEIVLFDFTKLPNLHGWSEMSDVVREVGKSKAVLVLQKTQRFQRGVLFTMLNPQPNGAGFAGFRTDTEFNLSECNKIQLLCKGQGENYGYKVVLRHKNENTEPFPSYEQMFQAPNRKFEVVDLPLAGFEPYYRGKKQNQSAPLDKSQITNFELQIYGGVYLPVKQAGTSSLEIDWVKAVP